MRRFISIRLIATGILLIAGVMTWLYVGNLTSQPAEVSLPDSIAGLHITNLTTGAQAAVEFKNLHGKQFPITSGAIGVYGNREITLWAAGAPLDFIASRMVEAMREKITEGNSPFTPIEQFNEGKRTIYVLEGMGQKHFYFQSKNLIIWLAVDPALADIAIHKPWRFIHEKVTSVHHAFMLPDPCGWAGSGLSFQDTVE